MTAGRRTAFALTTEIHCDAGQTLAAEPSSKSFIEARGRTQSRKEYRHRAIVVSRKRNAESEFGSVVKDEVCEFGVPLAERVFWRTESLVGRMS